MKYGFPILMLAILILCGETTVFAQQSVCDKECLQTVRGLLKASYMGGEGSFSSWSEKANHRLGDRAAVAILQIYKGKALYKPDNIRAFLPVISYAFEYPDMIENPQDKNPKVTAALLHRLKRRIKDHFLNLEVTKALNAITDNKHRISAKSV